MKSYIPSSARATIENTAVRAGCTLGSADRALPALVVLGAQKAGTTSFYHYDNNYRRGIDWYRAHFCKQSDLERGRRFTFEASPYYLFHPAVPKHVAAKLTDAKFVVMLRHPIKRAYRITGMRKDLAMNRFHSTKP
jgi:hypothetical protein